MANAKERVKNTASDGDLTKVFKANSVAIDSKCLLDIDDFAEQHHETVCDILRLTLRPSAAQVEKCVRKACPKMEQNSCNLYSKQVVEVLKKARNVSKSMSTGSKTTPGMMKIVDALRVHSKIPALRSLGDKIKNSPVKVSSSGSAKMDLPAEEAGPDKSVADLYKMDLPARPRKVHSAASGSRDPEVIMSSQEGAAEPEPAEPEPILPVAQFWVDSRKRRAAYMASGGAVKFAKMAPGPDGFSVAHITGESPGVATELPNALLGDSPAKSPARSPAKKPATAQPLKKPAAKVAKKPATVEPTAEQEEGEEELAEEDPEIEGEGSRAEVKIAKPENPGHVQSPELGECQIHLGTLKAYIQYKNPDGGWKSVVNLSAGHYAQRHNQVALSIYKKLLQPGFGLPQAAAEKMKLRSV